MSIPSSRITSIASGRTWLGLVPALKTSKRSPASWRRRPSAIWLRAEFPVQRMRTRFLSIILCREPVPGAVASGANREHDGHFHQDAYDCCQGGARLGAEQRNGGGDGQPKEIRSADKGARSGHGMLNLEPFHQAVSEAGVEVNLQSNRNRNQQYMEKPPCNVIRLKSKNEDQRAEQRRNGNGREFRQQHAFKPRAPVPTYKQGAQEHTGHQRHDDKHQHGGRSEEHT